MTTATLAQGGSVFAVATRFCYLDPNGYPAAGYNTITTNALVKATMTPVYEAGDHHPNKSIRDATIKTMEANWGIPVLFVEGNHDYYSSAFPVDCGRVVDVMGVRFALATLWTNLSPVDEMFKRNMNDFRCIKDTTVAKWNDMNRLSIEFLEKSGADVIVTHHAPSFQSVSPRWKNHFLNHFFANNLDLSLFPNAKIWFHGHVHDEFDYVQDGIRVLVNPWAYPNERAGSEKIEFITI